MEDMLQWLYARRSVRSFTARQPTQEQLLELMRAGCRAPSSKALYPCHFVLVQQRDALQKITEFHNMSKALQTAPAVIVTCADVMRSWVAWRDDCAAATMNMIYAARAMGLDSCWHGIYPRDGRVEPMRQLLELPAHILPYSMLAVGYAAAKKPPQTRFDESCVHPNGKW